MNNELNENLEKYIYKIYKNTNGILGSNEPYKRGENNIFTTYGEILPSSVTKLIKNIKINENDIIYDLGSGTGKFCNQIFLQTPAKKVKGIEIINSRYNKAINIRDLVINKFPSRFNKRELSFANENMNIADISDATIIFTCSTCFDEALFKLIISKVNEANNLKILISLKKLPESLNNFSRMEIVDIPCTWSKNTKAHIYYK